MRRPSRGVQLSSRRARPMFTGVAKLMPPSRNGNGSNTWRAFCVPPFAITRLGSAEVKCDPGLATVFVPDRHAADHIRTARPSRSPKVSHRARFSSDVVNDHLVDQRKTPRGIRRTQLNPAWHWNGCRRPHRSPSGRCSWWSGREGSREQLTGKSLPAASQANAARTDQALSNSMRAAAATSSLADAADIIHQSADFPCETPVVRG